MVYLHLMWAHMKTEVPDKGPSEIPDNAPTCETIYEVSGCTWPDCGVERTVVCA